MVMSVFGAFNIASAAETQTISTKATLKDDTATIVVSYEGFTKVSAIGFYLPLDADVFDLSNFDADANVVFGDAFAKAGTANFADSTVMISWYTNKTAEYTGESSDIITVTVPVKDKSKLPVELSATKVSIKDVTEAVYQAQEEVCQEREIRAEICRRQRVPVQGNRIRRRATGRKPNQEDKESKEEQEKG